LVAALVMCVVVSTWKVKPITEEYLRQQGRFAPD